MDPENKTALKEEDVKLPKSILSKIKVINDTPDIPLEPDSVDVTEKSIESNNLEKEQVGEANTDNTNTDNREVSNNSPSDTIETVEITEDVLLTRAEIKLIREKAKSLLTTIDSLFSQSTGEAELQSAIGNAFDSEYLRRLEELPIERLNDRKLGIRVWAIRSAGYYNIYSIRNITYNQLISIKGVGEKSASLALREISYICNSVERSINISPSGIGRAAYNKLMPYCYRYLKAIEWQRDTISWLRPYYDKLEEFLTKTAPSRGAISWVFTFKKRKKEVSDFTKDYSDFIEIYLPNRIDICSDQRNCIYTAANEIITADNSKRGAAYSTALKVKMEDYLTGRSVAKANSFKEAESLLMINGGRIKTLIGERTNKRDLSSNTLDPASEERIIALINNAGIKYIDNRLKHGALWILGGKELQEFVDICKKNGYEFEYAANGAKSTDRKPSWWLRKGGK